MAEFITDLEAIISNPNTKILMTSPVGGVEGFLVSNFTIGAGADYNSPFESAVQQQLNDVGNNLQVAAKTAANQLGFNTESIPALSLKTVANSLKQWTNSSPPVFNLQMIFVALKETDDVRKPVRTMYRTVMPTFQGSGLSARVLPPMGYQGILEEGALAAKNTLTITIGKWFKAPLQLMTNVSFEYSKTTLPNGLPLFASGSISFTPFRVISADELSGYLSGVV